MALCPNEIECMLMWKRWTSIHERNKKSSWKKMKIWKMKKKKFEKNENLKKKNRYRIISNFIARKI